MSTEDNYETYESTSEVEAAPVTSSQDVSSIIEQGLANLENLKARASAADAVVEGARADAADKLAEYKSQAAEAVAAARAEQTEAINAVRVETDATVKEVRDTTSAQVATAKAALDAEVADAVASAADVKDDYTNSIKELTQWLAPAALAAMGHSVSRRGRKS